MYFTQLYLFTLSAFVSSVGGFIFYKLSNKFLFPKKLSYILGGVVSLLLSYSFALLFILPLLFYGLLIGLAVYILFLVLSEKKS